MIRKVLIVICTLCASTLLAAGLASKAQATFDKRFDIVTFCCPCTLDDHMCQTQFDHLNWVSTNGHVLAMGTDEHRSDVNGNGNFLACYDNDLNTGWTTMTGSQAADNIEMNYIRPNFTNTGVETKWVILNEISGGTWPSNQTYRTWVHDVCARLKNTYSHSVIILSPFANPGANASDWQALASVAYIGVENYLSGQEVNASGNSVSWCQSQYQSSVNSYGSLGVSLSDLYLVEHFAQTLTNTGWGRSGVSYAGWDNAIHARSQAAHNIGFAGFVSYAWDKNAMEVSDTDLIHFEDTYAAQTLP